MAYVFLQLLVMVFVWSLSFIVVDIGVEFVPPLSLALYRFLIASLAFLIIRFITKYKKNKKIPETHYNLLKSSKNSNLSIKNYLFLLIIASFSGVSLFFYSQYTAIEMIGPSLPALFVCLLAPLLISLLALTFFNERLTKIKILGFIIATIGGFLLVTGGDINVLNPMNVNFYGYFFALLTPILWAFYTTATKKLSNHMKTIHILEYITYLGSLELFIFVLFSNELHQLYFQLLNPILLICVLYLALICHIFGYYLWTDAQKQIESYKAASFLYIEPFLTLIFSILLQREEIIQTLNIIGGIIVLVAVILINKK